MNPPLPDEHYLKEKLAQLLAIPSPTGYTDNAVRFVGEELERLGLKPELTRRGAIRAIRPGGNSAGARALVSHIDTLGAQIRSLKENGRAGLTSVGTWSSRFAEGARATVYTDTASWRGSILPLKASGHAFNEEVDNQPVNWDQIELRIDAPVRNSADLEALGIAIGDMVAIDPQPEFLENGFIVSRHLDNKGGVAIMLAALEAMQEARVETPVDIHFLFTIAEETGHGAASVLLPEVASMVAIDNGTSAPGQNSSEFGVTIAMADQSGPFDWHLTRKLIALCRQNGIGFQRDVFRYYRSDSASAIEAGADVRTALATFGVDASHGYERIHVDALTSVARLLIAYAASEVEIPRDAEPLGDMEGFTSQPDPLPE